jgi:hypothetical protein
MQYFILPTCCIAFNAKVGSSTLACAIVNKFYPEKLKKALDDYEDRWSKYSQSFKDSLPPAFQRMFNTDYKNSICFWQSVAELSREPKLPILLAVREPLKRFTSTVAYLKLTVEDTLRSLENDEEILLDDMMVKLRKNTHFLKQSIYNQKETKLYKFPDQLEQLCKDAGLDWPIEKINEGKYEKPILTDDQIERVKNYYKEDFALYNSL